MVRLVFIVIETLGDVCYCWWVLRYVDAATACWCCGGSHGSPRKREEGRVSSFFAERGVVGHDVKTSTPKLNTKSSVE